MQTLFLCVAACWRQIRQIMTHRLTESSRLYHGGGHCPALLGEHLLSMGKHSSDTQLCAGLDHNDLCIVAESTVTDTLAVQNCHVCAALLLDLYSAALLPGLVRSGRALSEFESLMLK